MPIRILIADDSPAVRTVMRQLLESPDWEIVEVENGQQALAKAWEVRPSVIILDLVMPVMDGLTAAREISKILPETPLLMHTLHWSPQIELEAQKVGVRRVVPKATGEVLLSVVQQLLASGPSASITPGSETLPLSIHAPAGATTPTVIEPGNQAGADKPDVSATGTDDAA